jgi:alkylhydroperoxidase family enzyme
MPKMSRPGALGRAEPALTVAPGAAATAGCQSAINSFRAARADGRDVQNWKICRKVSSVSADHDSRKYSALRAAWALVLITMRNQKLQRTGSAVRCEAG